MNGRFLYLVGFLREEFSNLRMEDYIAPEFLQDLRERHEARVRGEPQPTHFEYQGLRPDGKRRWLEVDVSVIAQSKTLAVELNPQILREGGLARALEWLGQRMRQ